MRPLIILLKSPDESAESDPYALALHDVGLDAAFLPVLRHAPVNERELQEVISRGAETAYGGVIVTSSRAAEMWSRAATGAMSALSSNGFDESSGNLSWRDVPFYAVGKKTSRALSRGLPDDSPFKPTFILGADESGTGSKLARFILSDYPSRSYTLSHGPAPTPTDGLEDCSHCLLPLLYLTGDKNTGTLQSTLATEGQGKLGLVALQTYKTWPRTPEEYEEEFVHLATRASSSPSCSLDITTSPLAWLVFFAPSGVQAVITTAQKHFAFSPLASCLQPSVSQSTADAATLVKPHGRIAAIGPTTAAYIGSSDDGGPGLQVDVVPLKPTAIELAEALQKAIQQVGT